MKGMDKNFKNKIILVTGGTGQVGSFLVEKLCKKGAKVFVIGRDKNNLKEIEYLVKLKKVIFLECDFGIKMNPELDSFTGLKLYDP